MERQVEHALKEAAELSGAFVWRRTLRDLEGPLHLLVLGRDDDLIERFVASLGAPGSMRITALSVQSASEDDRLGIQDRLFSSHASIWITPITQPLSAEEREILQEITALGVPPAHGVVLGDPHLLARMSDAPDRERAEIEKRVGQLLPPDWRLLPAGGDWLDEWSAETSLLARQQRAHVARLLLEDALSSLDQAVADAEQVHNAVADSLSLEDAALTEARREGERIAAHMLGAMRRNTEELLVDLRKFLTHLEQDLPRQGETIVMTQTLRRTLPHWLNHVVETWMSNRLDLWRATVLAELEEVRVREGSARVHLLPPALHPPPLSGDGAWSSRLGTTAALGGGAVLVFIGLWIPGLLALSGALAWSAVTEESTNSATRARLISEAVDAVRQMGRDAEVLLGDQLVQLEEELVTLSDNREQAARERQEDTRTRLEQQCALVDRRRADLQERRDTLAGRIADLELPSASASG